MQLLTTLLIINTRTDLRAPSPLRCSWDWSPWQ